MTIKPETISFIVCATSDLLSDASFRVDQWLLDNASRGFHRTINLGVLLGDGIGKPTAIFESEFRRADL